MQLYILFTNQLVYRLGTMHKQKLLSMFKLSCREKHHLVEKFLSKSRHIMSQKTCLHVVFLPSSVHDLLELKIRGKVIILVYGICADFTWNCSFCWYVRNLELARFLFENGFFGLFLLIWVCWIQKSRVPFFSRASPIFKISKWPPFVVVFVKYHDKILKILCSGNYNKKKYHHFRFCKQKAATVYCKEFVNSTEVEFDLLKKAKAQPTLQ